MSTEATRKVPSLSTKGWITTIPEKADKLLCYYFLAEKSQSDTYDIVSLPYQIATKGNRPNQIQQLIESDLNTYFSRYYPDGVDVNVTIVDKRDDGADIARYEIQTSVIIVVDRVKYSIAKLVSVVNSQISILEQTNNG